MNPNEPQEQDFHGLELVGTPSQRQLMMLQMLLKTTLEINAKLTALIRHVNQELAGQREPFSEEGEAKEMRRLTADFNQLWKAETEKLLGELAIKDWTETIGRHHG